ncbi:MAG: hypothetical protein P8010_20035, partial [Desulfosarcinaceae bacterium]
MRGAIGRQVLAIEPFGVAVDGAKGFGGVFGEAVDGNPVLLEVLDSGGDVDNAHEAAQDGLVGAARDAHDGLGGAH